MEPFSKLTVWWEGEKGAVTFLYTLSRYTIETTPAGVRKDHLHADLPGWGQEHRVVMELVPEEASRQQAVKHPPSALEATWFGDLGAQMRRLLIISALNNCLFISQSVA